MEENKTFCVILEKLNFAKTANLIMVITNLTKLSLQQSISVVKEAEKKHVHIISNADKDTAKNALNKIQETGAKAKLQEYDNCIIANIREEISSSIYFQLFNTNIDTKRKDNIDKKLILFLLSQSYDMTIGDKINLVYNFDLLPNKYLMTLLQKLYLERKMFFKKCLNGDIDLITDKLVELKEEWDAIEKLVSVK